MFSIAFDTAATPAQLALSGGLTIYEVAQAHGELLALLAANARVEAWRLDLAELEELDSAGVQLLLGLRRQLVLAGNTVEVVNLQGAALEIVSLLRLDVLLPGEQPAAA
ncbi:STAS domain-containing protein [Pseudomonas solani]|uniref:STAS domain-containing protein n=1 Tax=Pseudomonas solani TaxID=2731552 RepID=UPI003C2F7031